MKKRLLTSFIIVGFSLLAGCNSNITKPNESIAQLTSNKEKSYVIFFRESRFAGSGRDIDVLEYDTKTFKPTKNSAIIKNGTKAIFSVDPGQHSFFVRGPGMIGFAPKYALELDLKPGEIEYINVGFTKNGVFAPVIVDSSRLAMLDKFEKMICNPINLKRYSFSESSADLQEPEPIDPKVNFYESNMFYKIRCFDEKVSYAKDLYINSNIKEINNLENATIGSTDFSNYQQDISELSSSYIARFKNIAYSHDPVLNILNDAREVDLNKYDGIELNFISSGSLVDSSMLNEFNSLVSQKFSEKKNLSNETLKIVIDVYKLDNGSMAGRYLMGGMAGGMTDKRDNDGVIGVNVTYINNTNNQEIGKISISGFIGSGIFGGVNTLPEDTASLLKKYTDNTFMKQ